MKTCLSLLAICFLFLGRSTAFAEEAAASEGAEELQASAPEKVNRALLKIEQHPCAQERGLHRALCVISQRRGVIQPRSPAEKGLLTQALERRAKEKSGHLIPRWLTVPERIDTRSSDEKMAALTAKRRKIFTEREAKAMLEKPEEKKLLPLLQRRAKTGGRESTFMLPLCSRRHGLALIACLQELGVDLSTETLDEETWKIYERMRTGQ